MLRHVLQTDGAPRTRLAAVVLAALVVLIAAPVALAGWITINTNNNQSDNYGTPIYTSTCSNTGIDDYLEIKNAWIANDGTNLYFKLEACGTTTGYSSVRYAGGLDCNNDGDVSDPYVNGPDGDRKVVFLPGADQVYLVDGANNNIVQLQGNQYSERIGSTALFEWQMPLQYIYPACRASEFAIKMGVGTALFVGGRPQTKDQTPETPWSIPIDYGDASNPDPSANPPTCTQYPVRIGCDGARHGTAGTLRLGALEDPDGGNIHTADASGDDLDNQADEDGVTPTVGVKWVSAGQGSLDVTVNGGNGYLNCWVDWNNDKDWADSGEKIVNDAAVSAGLSTKTFSVPSVAFPNSFIARCRLSPAAGQGTNVTGAVEFGEIEDNQWVFGSSGNRPVSVTVTPSINGSALRLSWTNNASNEGYLVLSSALPYFLPGDPGVSTTPDPDNSSPFDATGTVGGPIDAIYYVVQGQVTSSTPDLTSAPSNRVGLYEFTLVPAP